MAGMLGKSEVVDLEGMVDRASVAAVLVALEYICYEKGTHLRENWQDEGAAKTWERDGKKIGLLATKVFT
jgi:hypothetical protein